jgi:hypothetical protein
MDKPRKVRSDKGKHVGHTLEELEAKWAKPTHPIIDIYLPDQSIMDTINDAYGDVTRLSVDHILTDDIAIVRAAARYATKQFMEWLKKYANYDIDTMDFTKWHPEASITFEITVHDMQALLKLVEEK